MSNKIIFIEKPDEVSWESIHQVLWEAHESTRKNGLFYPTSEMTGNELNQFLYEHNGRCFVAMDGDDVVGTMSCYIEDIKTRLFSGKFLKIVLVGNKPKYKRRGIFSKLYDICYNYAKSEGLDGITYGTAERNYTMRKIFESKGFISDRCHYNKDKQRFIVGGIYCFKKPPHRKEYYALIFKIKQLIEHLRHLVS